jgi:peptidoglycan-associated lipoprotein
MTTTRMMLRIVGVATVCAATGLGCGGKAKKQAIPTPTGAASANATPATAEKPVAASPNVGVDSDLAKQCGLRFANTESAPKFGFDDAELLPADRDVLQQVANCLIKGPLAGRGVQLVGRADPRGTDEYNLGLGTRRAQTVKTYLERLGVPAARMYPTTRGDVDASGRDETGWQRDRRVDLQLVR